MEKSKKKYIKLESLCNEEKLLVNGGNSAIDAGKWVGCKIKSAWNWFTTPGEPSEINYKNFQDYVNPNDPLM